MWSLDSSRLRTLLGRSGYRLLTRRDGWTECLITDGRERWLGRGANEDEAIRDAAEAMFPSAIARRLLEEQLARGVALPRPGTSVRGRGAGASGRAGSDERAERLAREPAPEAEDEAAAPAEPDATASAEGIGRKSGGEDGQPPPRVIPLHAEREGAGGNGDHPDADVSASIASAEEIDEGFDELDLLRRRIRDAQSELSTMAPHLQRLHILAWICRARAVQERLPHVLGVERAVGDIARHLQRLGRLWWPGSVKALQLRATPLDAGAEMGFEAGGRLHDWTEAAEKVEERLGAELERVGSSELDLEGWADRACLEPAPNAPEALLHEVNRAMERLFGPLHRDPPRHVARRLRKGSSRDVEQLLEWARKLRWLRGHVDDEETWGACMGRLRWAAAQLPDEPARPLQEALDPFHCPSRPWPALLGQDPRAKRRRRRRREILERRPGSDGAAPDREELAEWLTDAFELGEELDNPRIAGLLHPVRDVVLALQPEELVDNSRRTRKRLADLKRRLEAMNDAEAEALRRETDKELGSEAAPEDETPEAPAEAEQPAEATPEQADPLEPIARQVRRHTVGKRALFVSNRKDPELKERLEERLGLEITWTVIDPRRVQHKCESVSRGTYDLVLSATGFQGHNVDKLLCRAARSAGVPYVRVNRGRPRACIRSLARDLGLEVPHRIAR